MLVRRCRQTPQRGLSFHEAVDAVAQAAVDAEIVRLRRPERRHVSDRGPVIAQRGVRHLPRGLRRVPARRGSSALRHERPMLHARHPVGLVYPQPEKRHVTHRASGGSGDIGTPPRPIIRPVQTDCGELLPGLSRPAFRVDAMARLVQVNEPLARHRTRVLVSRLLGRGQASPVMVTRVRRARPASKPLGDQRSPRQRLQLPGAYSQMPIREHRLVRRQRLERRTVRTVPRQGGIVARLGRTPPHKPPRRVAAPAAPGAHVLHCAELVPETRHAVGVLQLVAHPDGEVVRGGMLTGRVREQRQVAPLRAQRPHPRQAQSHRRRRPSPGHLHHMRQLGVLGVAIARRLAQHRLGTRQENSLPLTRCCRTCRTRRHRTVRSLDVIPPHSPRRRVQ